MSKQEWEGIYHEAWSLYYSPKHVETLLRRAVATGVRPASIVKLLVLFSTTVELENVHPMQSGFVRMKHPTERRPGLPPVKAWVFWPQFGWETLRKSAVMIGALVRVIRMLRSIQRDPNSRNYMDQALTPVHDGDDETLDLMTKTTGARAAVAHIKRVDELTHARGAA
jgi:hypothetical protein